MRVKTLVADGKLVVQTTRASAFFPTRTAAIEAAATTIAALTEREFHDTIVMTYDVCDVYGVVLNGGGWYLKLTIDETVPEVLVISLHPLERPLRTNKGMVNP